MCVAIPGRIVAIGEGTHPSIPAEVRFANATTQQVDLVMVPDATVGDYVVVHSGYAISKVGAEVAEETIRLFANAGRSTG